MTSGNNPHSHIAREALIKLKQLSGSLDGWDFASEKEGVKLYSQGAGVPLVRGDTELQGHTYTPQQVLAVASSPGARKFWDEKFDRSEIKEIYNRYESVFWGKVKTPWPISPRDMSATLLREFGDNESYIVMVSVEDERIPEISGNVRANLMISGWRMYKTDTGVGVTYVTQIDLAGSIPTSFLKSIQIQVPLCAGKVVRYIEQYGFPPYTVGGDIPFQSEEFDNDKKEYTVKLDGQGPVQWQVSHVMYPKGFVVETSAEYTKEDQGKTSIVTAQVQGPTSIVIKSA